MNDKQARETKIVGVAAVIMAGGRGRRMGREKCLIEFGGKTLLAWMVEGAQRVFERVIISGPAGLARPGVPAFPDERPGAGPLAGIMAGLKAAGTPWIMALPCDSPFVPELFLRGMASLASGHDVVVPRRGEWFEPLHALYSVRCLPYVERLIGQGERRIITLYDLVKTREVGPELVSRWDPHDLAFFNINTPADLARAQAILAGSRS
ncbi:MAG TPA: molybdenum cofactor guanylyltransferase [bacterium]|nr:molybdenum cofactor guanylyltransferase [bacterium]